MWKDPFTGAQYTQAEKDVMTGNPVYENLLGRLCFEGGAPEPTDAQTTKKDGNKVVATTDLKDNGLSSK
jgi:hypothetical protein